MKITTDLEQINERLNEIDKYLKSLISKKKIIDRLIYKKFSCFGFFVFKSAHSLLREQKELQNTIIYLEDYKDMLLKQQVEVNNKVVKK